MRYCAAAEQRAHAASNLISLSSVDRRLDHVLDAEKPFAIYLNDSFLRRARVMFHASRYRGECVGCHRAPSAFVKLLTHTQMKSSAGSRLAIADPL